MTATLLVPDPYLALILTWRYLALIMAWPPVERQRDERRRLGTTADIDGQPAAVVARSVCRPRGLRCRRVEVGHGDRLTERRGRRAAGDRPALSTLPQHRITMPGNSPGLADKPGKGERRPVLGPPGERGSANEVTGLVQLHQASESCFERGDVEGQLIAIQRHAGLEPERIACGQPGGYESVAEASRGQRLPYGRGVGWFG